jgi:hypothetical protein
MLIAAGPQFAGSTVQIRNSTPFPPTFATEFSPAEPEDLVRSNAEREETLAEQDGRFHAKA